MASIIDQESADFALAVGRATAYIEVEILVSGESM
jgi:hypothetical protein